MKKRFPALCLAALLLLSCLAFAACGSSGKKSKFVHSETFEGALAEESYDTQDDAIAAFLETEVSGSTITAELVKVEVKEELTKTQIAQLAIPAEEKKNIRSVREIIVKYRDKKATSAQALAAFPGFGSTDKDTSDEKEPSKDPSDDKDDDKDETDTHSQRVYVCEFEDGSFKYFVPMLTNGEKLTKSYFESVMNADQYQNCTFDFKLTTDIKRDGKTDNSIDWTAAVKITEDVIYEHDDQKVNSAEGNQTIAQDLYVKEKDGRLGGVISQKVMGITVKDFQPMGSGDFTSLMDRVLKNWFGASVDYTYFEKSDVGFALRSDKMREFMEYLLNKDGFGSSGYVKNLQNYDAEYTIYVSEGRIYQCTCKYSYTTTYGGSTISVKGSYQINLSAFGRTTCKVPADIEAEFPESFY